MPGIMRWVKVLFWQSVVLERVLKKLGNWGSQESWQARRLINRAFQRYSQGSHDKLSRTTAMPNWRDGRNAERGAFERANLP